MKLSVAAPREYSLRDAYDRRVWRTPIAVVCRELFFWALGVLTLGVVYNHALLMLSGGAAAVAMLLAGGLASWRCNRARVALICSAPASKGTLGLPRRVPMLHELFRGQRESTYILPYTFTTEAGETRSGRLWICGCARTHLPAKSIEWILYDPDQPGRSLPLRVAVMVAPH